MDLLTECQKRLAEQVEPWGWTAVLIFRGQRDGSWALNSSADRRLEKESKPPALIDYLTKVLIEPARSEGYAHQHNRELNDLEFWLNYNTMVQRLVSLISPPIFISPYGSPARTIRPMAKFLSEVAGEI